MLSGSFLLHVVFFFLVILLRVTSSFDEPLASYKVSLVSLSDLQASGLQSSPVSSQPRSKPKSQPKPPPPMAAKKAKKVQLAPKRERFSESFAGALKTIQVPEPLERTKQREEPSELSSAKQKMGSEEGRTEEILNSLRLPPKAPELSEVQPLAPLEQADTSASRKRIVESLKETVQSVKLPKRQEINPESVRQPTAEKVEKQRPMVQERTAEALQGIKLPPQAPKLTPLQPFAKPREPTQKSLKGLKLPTEVPKLTPIEPTNIPQSSPRQPRERLADSLKTALDQVIVPKQRERPTPRLQPEEVQGNLRKETEGALKGIRLPPEAPKLAAIEPSQLKKRAEKDVLESRLEIDQKLATLRIPDVPTLPSFRDSHDRSSPTPSGSSKGKEEAVDETAVGSSADEISAYLALIEAHIKRMWVAPPIGSSDRAVQVVVRFTLHRSGEVSDVVVERSSGNTYYDQAGQRAVMAARPLPPFPPEISHLYLSAHFTFTVGKEG